MYSIRAILLCFSLLFPIGTFAFDASCFRETASFTPPDDSLFQVAVSSLDERIYFVQEDVILPSTIFSTEKNPPILYTISGLKDISSIHDFDANTFFQIDPYDLSKHDVVWNIDLARVYEPGTMHAHFDYTTRSRVIFEVSSDGKSYFAVSRDAIEDFPVRYIRMTFSRLDAQSSPSIVRGIDFFENVHMRFLIKTDKKTPIRAYRSLACDATRFISWNMTESVPTSAKYTTIIFEKNPLYTPDSDGDTVENMTDNCISVSNPNQEDRNYDGIWDACSDDDIDGISWVHDNCPTISNRDQTDKNVNSIGDACEFDTDSDSIPDGIDNAIHVANADQKDSDIDHIGDIIDNCHLYNPDQLDLDKNGAWDVCDRDVLYRKTNDRDGDSVLDYTDNCDKIANPDQRDDDTDGIWNICDNCIALQNIDQTDTDKNAIWDACEDRDKDGIDGWRDNCPTLSNPNQEDSDNNQIWNACTDTDNDAHFDSIDNCPAYYNPDQNNIDNDEQGDLCDAADDRFLESNKYLFMGLIWFFAILFIGVITFLFKKIQ